LSISPTSQWAAPGETKVFTLTITNNDSASCGNSNFFGGVTISSGGISQSPSSYNKTLTPGTSTTQSINISTPSSASEGYFQFTNEVVNSSDGSNSFRTTVTASFNIANTTCTRDNPLLWITPFDGYGTKGSTLSYELSIQNLDSMACGNSTFLLTSTTLPGWSVSLIPPSLSMAPRTTAKVTYRVTSPADAPASTVGNFTVTGTNSTLTSFKRSTNARYHVQGASKVGDLNGDNQVNIFDLSALLSVWGTNDQSADLNASGNVDIFDMSILLSNWGS
jgi:hypothetical protein